MTILPRVMSKLVFISDDEIARMEKSLSPENADQLQAAKLLRDFRVTEAAKVLKLDPRVVKKFNRKYLLERHDPFGRSGGGGTRLGHERFLKQSLEEAGL